MKTKDLIEALQAADPSGEIECCVGNEDIHFVSREPAYWDGCLQTFERDPKLKGQFDIRGGIRTAEGDKIQIHSLGLRDLFTDLPDLPIRYVGMSKNTEDWYRMQDEEGRAEARKDAA